MNSNKRIALLLEYNGSAFSGWQVQLNAHTVQAELERAMQQLSGRQYKVIGSGRTDSGVHAAGQVAHVDLDEKWTIPDSKTVLALNSRLNAAVRVLDAQVVSEEFHARFDPTAREYSYLLSEFHSVALQNRVWQCGRTLDLTAMQEAATVFEGKHDFTSFSKMNHDTKSYICNVQQCSIHEVRRGIYRVAIRADRFVYAMVRSIVSAIVEAGTGKRKSNELAQALQEKNRQLNAAVAPPHGLTLYRVQYPTDVFASWYTGDSRHMKSHITA